MTIKFTTLTLALTASALLAGCGGGSSNNAATVPDLPAVAISPANGAALISAVSNRTFPFPAATGVAALRTTGPTNVVFSGQNFTISQTGSGAGSYSGNVGFGSCIFTVTSSTLPGVNPGDVFTVNPCSLDVNTAGQIVGTTTERDVVLVLGTASSTPVPTPVTVTTTGGVSIGTSTTIIGTVSTGTSGTAN